MSFQVMTYKIVDIEGIGPEYAERLLRERIETTGDLLDRVANPMERQAIAQRTGISETLLTKWFNMADLMRVKGIGPQYSELLLAAGVESVEHLRNWNPELLVKKLEDVNAERKLSGAVPHVTDVQRWLDEIREPQPVTPL